MQIGIDFSSVVYDRGVSRYTHNLIMSLLEHGEHPISLFASSMRQKSKLIEFAAKKYPRAHKVSIASYPPSILSWLWRLQLEPVQKHLPQISVFHSWDWLQPPDTKIPIVSTIHDLAMLKYPDVAHKKILSMHQKSWKRLKKKQSHIIAVSQATKQDIMEYLEIPGERIHVVYEALPTETITAAQRTTEDEEQQIISQLNLTSPFILFVGTREPRKNLERLIEAWSPLSKDIQLIIAGEKGWDGSEKYTATYGSKLKFLGKVTDKQLAVLYGEAELLAYPSLYEGFGLPILEAFHHGTPVVTANTSSMPEVAGNAAVLVDPNSPESIRKGIETILNENPAEQKQRLQKMIIRLHSFSWSRVALDTLAVYSQAIQHHEN